LPSASITRSESRDRLAPCSRLWEPDHPLVVGRLAVTLHDLVAGNVCRGAPHLLDRHGGLELDDDDRPAGELDAPRQAARRERDDPGGDHERRQRNGVPAPLQEVERRILEQMHG
jgi:hypothetical protein